jgi:hypothetical protein
VVAELVEALDDAGRREVLLDDDARAVHRGGELVVVAVDGLPVVHRVDEDLAGEQITWQLAEAMHRDGQDDDVCVAHDLVGRGRAGAGSEHVDRQRDVVGRRRSRHGDVVAGRDRGAGKRRAELARAHDAEPQVARLRRWCRAGQRPGGLGHRASTAAASGDAASSSRTRGITSRP